MYIDWWKQSNTIHPQISYTRQLLLQEASKAAMGKYETSIDFSSMQSRVVD